MKTNSVDILLVEDSVGDVELIRCGLKGTQFPNTIHVVTDGVDAMSFLRSADEPRPNLVLLDINLPKMNGHEVLHAMHEDAQLCTIPVVVLTSSNHDSDVRSAYEHHASAFVQKPLKIIEFVEVIKSIEGFWLKLVQLPPKT